FLVMFSHLPCTTLIPYTTLFRSLVKNGEFISEFSAEKVAYFLQRFGARDVFNLDYKKNFYGPYSGKVKHVLYYLNGSYTTGYSSDRKSTRLNSSHVKISYAVFCL